jgi:hypothetical protein
MDETVHQIEGHIDQARRRLGSNLKELERRVDAATDWREQFRARPYTGLGVAFAGGVLLAAAFRHRSTEQWIGSSKEAAAGAPFRSGIDAREQALDFWNNIKGALIGVATTRVKDYIDELIPGFQEHFQRAEERTGTSRRPTHDAGRG